MGDLKNASKTYNQIYQFSKQLTKQQKESLKEFLMIIDMEFEE